jgi:hypothetical protein
MRYAMLALCAILIGSGCAQRSNMAAMPDRKGHAFNPDPYAGTSGERPGAATRTPVGEPARRGNERSITVGAEERLYQIAEREGCDLWWLITRNDLVTRPKPGDVLVVPR